MSGVILTDRSRSAGSSTRSSRDSDWPASVMLEVSYHISASVDSADRPRWEGALVQHYLECVSAAGAEPPSFEEAMHQYGVFLTYGHFIWLTTESHYQPEAVNTANAARVSAAMLDHDTIGLVAALA